MKLEILEKGNPEFVSLRGRMFIAACMAGDCGIIGKRGDECEGCYFKVSVGSGVTPETEDELELCITVEGASQATVKAILFVESDLIQLFDCTAEQVEFEIEARTLAW